jgi:hypothetical protein
VTAPNTNNARDSLVRMTRPYPTCKRMQSAPLSVPRRSEDGPGNCGSPMREWDHYRKGRCNGGPACRRRVRRSRR